MSPQELSRKKLLAIFQALIRLLEDHRMSDISVAVLCREAGVSRTYYYHHFQSYADIIYQENIMSVVQYMRQLPDQGIITTTTMFTRYFELAAQSRDTQLTRVKVGLESSLIHSFESAFEYLVKNDLVVKAHPSRIGKKYWTEFLAGAVVNMAVRWLQTGMGETPAQMGRFVSNFVGLTE
jgi:AcrR family transcriptional regulator